MVFNSKLFLIILKRQLKKYEHLFFDLDRTLWDFESNSTETILDLHTNHQLEKHGIHDFEVFINKYKLINARLWGEYREGKIQKDELRLERFHQTFKEYGLDNPKLALTFNDDYVANCSKKTKLLEGSIDLLDYLSPNYQLHIITNGFVEAQYVKIKASGLEKYFQEVIVSDEFGYRKPDPRIFKHALETSGAKLNNSLMIGDDYEADIIGAKKLGIDQAFLNLEGIKTQGSTYEIQKLSELKKWL